MNTITDLLKQLKEIQSKENFHHLFTQIINRFRYNWAGMIVFHSSAGSSNPTSFFGDIPEQVKCSVFENETFKRYCFNESFPINYQDLLLENKHQEPILLVPINGAGNELACLLLAVHELEISSSTIEKLGWFWLMLSPLIYDKYHKVFKPNRNNIMTKRELECMKWAAEGKTSWEISQLLNISQRTVDFHLSNCISKTGSINRQQAIVKCVLDGQLLAI